MEHRHVGYGSNDEHPWDFFLRMQPFVKSLARKFAREDHDLYEHLISMANERWQSIYDNWIPALGSLFTHMKANLTAYFSKDRRVEWKIRGRNNGEQIRDDHRIAPNHIAEHDAQDRVNYLLQSLDDDQREMVRLHIEGWTFEEIGNVFNLSRHAARNRLARIMAGLRALHGSHDLDHE